MIALLPASWLSLLFLGGLHGLNPGMGWLFAVALGLQRQDRRAVWGALLPLAAGHAISVAAVLAAGAALQVVLDPGGMRWVVAATLLAVAVIQWKRHRHPRFGGMQVGVRELTIWSFLMATGHGAGLMALPFALRAPTTPGSHDSHLHQAATASIGDAVAILDPSAVVATVIHSAGYLLMTGVIAVLVYERLGLRLLRRGWFNVDRLWAVALVVTAAMILPG